MAELLSFCGNMFDREGRGLSCQALPPQSELMEDVRIIKKAKVMLRLESDAYLVVVAVFKTAAPTLCAGG